MFGDTAMDIQHVGSTAICHIKAKPIIDIAVGVGSLDMLSDVLPRLDAGIYKRSHNRHSNDLLYVINDLTNDTRTHQIHILPISSVQWRNFVDFRDYMNAFPEKASAYEQLKFELACMHPDDTMAYTDGKKSYMEQYLFEARLFADLRQKYDLTDFRTITAGLSGDEKYYLETVDGRKMLLRVSDLSEHDRKKELFDRMKQAADRGVPMCAPLEFGFCDNGNSVCQLLTWCEGENLETMLPLLPETQQYVLGLQAGEILRKIHSIPAPDDLDDWSVRYFGQNEARIKAFSACGVHIEGSDAIVRFVDDNKTLLDNRPQCFHHGDYHVGNFLLKSGELSVIDWEPLDYDNFADPWEEFNRIGNSDEMSHFATGLIHGYFSSTPPAVFWRLLKFYLSAEALMLVSWAFHRQPDQLDYAIRHVQDVLSWYDQMRSDVPAWYLSDFYIQYTDQVPYKLKEPFDFSFLSKYGKAFKVYDDQDSGNICFGVENNGTRYFVKFAGAPTARASVLPAEAIANLRRTVPVYRDLAHPNLIRLISAEKIGGGFAMVFEWTDGMCLGKQYPLSRRRFLQMPIETRLKVFEQILAFHAHVIRQGYVAIDFYDGSILYDAESARTLICDIDFYARTPCTNTMGRMWGSSRFMSPEEFTLGAVIDVVTNVYTMGATAFALLAHGDRSPEAWPLGNALYTVVQKAVSADRKDRQQSIEQLITEWNEAKEGQV